MGSINAKMVALEVVETVRKGKRVNLGKIMKKNGYAGPTTKNPRHVTDTKSYKEVINPIVQALEKERDAIMKRLPKVRAQAKYRDLMDGLDKTTKNIQLLSGKETSREDVTYRWIGEGED